MGNLTLVGTLPISAINTGLAASVGGLNAQITKLTADVSGLSVALASQLELTGTFPPDPSIYGSALLSVADPTIHAAIVSGMLTGSFTVNADLVIDLGIIDAALTVLEPLDATLQTGLNAGALAGWSYSGSAAGFGSTLHTASLQGFGSTGPNDTIAATIIATESFSSWGSMAAGFNVGDSAQAPADPADDRLRFMGETGALALNTGVVQFRERLSLFLGELRGSKTQIQNSILVSGGLSLPDPGLVLGASAAALADIGVAGLLDNLVNVHADITGCISGVQGDINATVSLVAQLNGQLSAGGLCCWTYAGPASGLGAALEAATKNGIPSGTGPRAAAYGLVIAGPPSSMSAFGSIFLA